MMTLLWSSKQKFLIENMRPVLAGGDQRNMGMVRKAWIALNVLAELLTSVHMYNM